jgi:hypothetical protein
MRSYNTRVISTRAIDIYQGLNLDSDVLAIIAAMTVKPDRMRAYHIQSLVTSLKSGSNNWSKIDCLGVLASHDRQASKINWKNPAVTNPTEHASNMQWVMDRGFFCPTTGTDGINSNWSPTIHGVNFQLNDHSYGTYTLTDSDNGRCDMGYYKSSVTVNRCLLQSRTGNLLNTFDSNNISVGKSNTNSLGLHSIVRTNSSQVGFYKNGSSLGVSTSASVSLQNFNFGICALFQDNTTMSPSGRVTSFYYMGAGSVNQSELSASINNYMIALGGSVI